MTNRQYRLLFGALLISALYFEQIIIIYVLIGLAVFEAITLSFAQSDPVNYARMVQGIADYRILCRQKGFKQASVGVETR